MQIKYVKRLQGRLIWKYFQQKVVILFKPKVLLQHKFDPARRRLKSLYHDWLWPHPLMVHQRFSSVDGAIRVGSFLATNPTIALSGNSCHQLFLLPSHMTSPGGMLSIELRNLGKGVLRIHRIGSTVFWLHSFYAYRICFMMIAMTYNKTAVSPVR